jgi:DUF438 domain-containing protein
MELNAKTKINDLLNEYPFLIDFLISKSPHFKKLKNPAMRKTVGKVATLSQAAAIGKIDVDLLLKDIAREIENRTGPKEPLSRDEKKSPEPLRDPKAREDILKGIIRDLHEGESMEKLKLTFQKLIQDVSPSEIANMEQNLIDEGMPESEVKRLCDVHVAVFKEALEQHEIPDALPGHPVHTFMKENRASEEIMDQIEALVGKMGTPPNEEIYKGCQKDLGVLIDRLSKINIHYLRKENQLFPLLEAHDISGPSQVMWAIHDDIRALIKTAQRSISGAAPQETVSTIKDLTATIREMTYKEENILYPMSLSTLTDSDWAKVKEGEAEIGFAWVEPEQGWVIPETAEKVRVSETERFNLDTGSLSKDLTNLMLVNLPVDLTLVDEDDRVAYYSKGKERIFPRSPGIIGRKVQRCHPPDSVHAVEKILEAFKNGKRDSAEFWIQLGGKFILIKYFPLRDGNGYYKGCLEVSQDITEIRQLEGEKRLLDDSF